MPAWGHVIDVPIEDTGYIIRQTLADQAVALPQTVQLLQLLAYLTLLIIPLEPGLRCGVSFFLLSGN